MFYNTFDLESTQGNFNPEVENSVEFKHAVTVSGVETPEMMFLLHKRFSQIEIDKAYREIEDIQVGLQKSAYGGNSES